MTQHQRSLKYEYELYVEQELEAYKESVPRSTLLRIGDEAVAALAAQQQLALTELLLCEEVDRIIRKRLRVPSFRTWCRRRQRALEEFRRPERWGLSADSAVARTVPVAGDGHVLVAGAHGEGLPLFLAANGCAVTALDTMGDVVERVMTAAVEVGLTARVRGLISDLGSWAPDLPLDAVICEAAAFEGLSRDERARAITSLQVATTDGGVHVMEEVSSFGGSPTLDELRTSYTGWQILLEPAADGGSHTFSARKVA